MTQICCHQAAHSHVNLFKSSFCEISGLEVISTVRNSLEFYLLEAKFLLSQLWLNIGSEPN